MVLPELAESRLDPPLVTNLRRDMGAFDHVFHLPAARMRVVTSLAGAGSPWLAFGEETLTIAVTTAERPALPRAQQDALIKSGHPHVLFIWDTGW